MNLEEVTLSLTDEQHKMLKGMLFPGDGMEAVAFILCGRRCGKSRHRLLAQKIFQLPPQYYKSRSPILVEWLTDGIVPILEEAEQSGLSVVKVHSHPTGIRSFSEIDDLNDKKLFPAIKGWVESDMPHASVIMLPDGEMFGRFWCVEAKFKPLHLINVVGNDLKYWFSKIRNTARAYSASQEQAFGAGTTNLLGNLSAAIIGCSGTGSLAAEQLVRSGIGKVVLVDPDRIEARNLNRILNATAEDVKNSRFKTELLADFIGKIGLGTDVTCYNENLWNQDVAKAVAECDVVFGCMDSHEGRYLLNRLASYYIIPYFDVGVRLDADNENGIRQISGSVQYLIPGKSSLLTRKKINMQMVQAEGLKRNDKAAYNQQTEKDSYIKGVHVHAPAVMPVNMHAASLLVMDFFSRLHPYRDADLNSVGNIEFCLSGLMYSPESESEMEEDNGLKNKVGLGDTLPLLGQMELS